MAELDRAAIVEGLAGWRFAAEPELLEVAVAAVGGVASDRRAEAVQRLSTLGRVTEDRERGAWDRAAYRSDPQADGKVAELFARWAAGNPWGDQGAWLQLLSRPVMRSFRQALSHRPLPPDVVARALADLEEALFYQLLEGAERPGGLREIAVGVIEASPGGPVASLMGVLSDRERGIVTACICRRGHWPDTVARVLPELPGASERALHLRERVAPELAEAWLDLHVVMRLVHTWQEGEPAAPERDRAIVIQNRGRARGRLRAVALRRSPAELLPAVLALDDLADRTRAAARRWAWSWAWEALATGFAFDLEQPVVRPCHAEAGLEPLEADDLEVLRVWALLVALRGRWSTLVRWCQTGEGDSDGTWGRLLGELPPDLRDPGGGLSRVRSALGREAPRFARELAPLAQAIGALPEGRSLKEAFWTVVDPAWDDAIRRPQSGFPTMRRHAIAWVLQVSEPSGGVPPGGQEPAP